LYGEDRARAFLIRHRHNAARRICDDLLADINAYSGDVPPTDDTTLAVVKVG
jgi:serine phosphatase RsbU (regulator of sigma subunit)